MNREQMAPEPVLHAMDSANVALSDAVAAAWGRTTAWRRLSEGDVPGRVMPLDRVIGDLRRSGMSLGKIATHVGKAKSYVQNRLLRIAAREDFSDAA